MNSGLHKVLHSIAGRPMLSHLLDSIAPLAPERTLIVVGSGRAQVEPVAAAHGAEIIVQESQLGTGHAVLQAKEALAGFAGDILILYADTPFVTTETLARMRDRLARADATIVVLASRPADPRRYGRILADKAGAISRMVEHVDASPEELRIDLCNSGMMAVRAGDLWPLLARVGTANKAGEYYLPDIVMLAAEQGARAVVVEAEPDELEGVNSRAELAAAEACWQRRRREEMMAAGVSLIAPESVFFAYDTLIGRDTRIEPYVIFGPKVRIGEGALIRAFSHIEGAEIADGAEIGPFARLRPGTEIGKGAKIGNFVEVKKTKLGAGAKANHLSYLGDADIGAAANIGAGTITCNYDGFGKHRTIIGEGAFIGSNSALVAPVTIGAGALVAAGSAITRDVAADAVAVARGVQQEKPGAAKKFRERREREEGRK